MLIVILSYKKPIEEVEKYTAEHRAYLDQGYQKGYYLMSGPQIPRTGGIIVSLVKNKVQLEEIMQKDPFIIHGIAEYKIIEFNPVKYHPVIADIL